MLNDCNYKMKMISKNTLLFNKVVTVRSLAGIPVYIFLLIKKIIVFHNLIKKTITS